MSTGYMPPDYVHTADLADRLDELVENEEDGTLAADDVYELAELRELRDEIAGDAWGDETMIAVGDAFEDYARELAEDIGAIDRNADWPCYCIDWERAARDLAVDYAEVEFCGRDYYVRAY